VSSVGRNVVPESLLLRLWGKTDRANPERYHPLLFHMLDAAAVCEALALRFARTIPIPSAWLAYLVGLHDVGKADPLFQNKAPELADGLRASGLHLPLVMKPFRHEARSAEWVCEHLRQAHGWPPAQARLISQAIAGHHGSFHPGDANLDESVQRRPEWGQLRDSLANEVAIAVTVPPSPPPEFADLSRVGAALTGLIVLSDWIASNEELFLRPPLPYEADPRKYLEAARADAGRAVQRLHFESAEEAETVTSRPRFCDVWPHCTDLRPVQEALEELCQRGVPVGLTIIEAPTGDGKTEAAIYLAEQWRRSTNLGGAYIALPTAATSNQMHGRYAAFLTQQRSGVEPVLVHGMAWLLDDLAPNQDAQTWGDDPDEGDLSRDWFRNAKRALLAPEGVGTVDQAMMAALNVKHGVLRLLGLSSKVLIIDEVHAYDEYMSTILVRLLQWCRALETPVILLSATLSSRQKQSLAEAYGGASVLPQTASLAPYPLLTFVSLEGGGFAVPVHDDRRRHVCLERHEGLLTDPAATANLAVEQVREGGCACVIANTVADAQAIYGALSRFDLAETKLILFHARFRAERRQELEAQVTGLFGKDAGRDGRPPRPERAILVATQVVEQSLDLDFDVMLSPIAPVDLLLQRAGRLHRHDRGERPTGPKPTLHILLPAAGCFDFGATEVIYQRLPLLRTLALLQAREQFDLPQDFRLLVEACYGEEAIPEGVVSEEMLHDAEGKWRAALEQAQAQAHLHLIPEPHPREFRLALNPRLPVGEAEEGARADYFHAQTRLGGDRRRVLVLHNPHDLEAVQQESAPNRKTLRRLLLQTVDLPAWWTRDLSAEEGFAPIAQGPRWLNRLAVLVMRGGEWRGRDSRGRLVVLHDDPELGMQREMPTDAGSEEARDADV